MPANLETAAAATGLENVFSFQSQGMAMPKNAQGKVKVVQSCPTLSNPMDYTVQGSWLFPSPRDHPNPEIEPRSLTLQADSLPAEPQGKPKLPNHCTHLTQ